MTASTTIVPADPSAEHLNALLTAQRAAFLADGPPSAATRRDRVDRLMLGVLEHADDLAAAMEQDFGSRPPFFSLVADILGTMDDFWLLRENIENWMASEAVAGSAERGTPTVVERRPKGTVGVIGPWNFPVMLVLVPTIEALAAGNRVMIKMSEVTTRTAAVFAEFVAERFDPAELVVIRGERATSATFSALRFDHIVFTGSVAVGRNVAATAGRNLVPVTLELGGKNPAVVARDADLKDAATRIAAGRMLNGGQACLSPDYAFVPGEHLDDFVSAYRVAVEEIFPDYGTNPGVVPIVNDAGHRRVLGLIEDARTKGARVLTFGEPSQPGDRRVPPTVVLGVTDDMAIATEEIFGPVLAVFPYADIEDAIAYVNDRPAPLAAYWFGPASADYRTFVDRTASGGFSRNDVALHHHVPGAPFGGVGGSGNGAYHGRAGFDALSHLRAVAGSDLDLAASLPYLAVTAPPRDALDMVRGQLGTALDGLRAAIRATERA